MTSHSSSLRQQSLPVSVRAGVAYPLLVSLLDEGNVFLWAYAWMKVQRAVKGEAARKHEGQNASHAPSVMSQEVHGLGPPLTAVHQVSQRCQHVRRTEGSSGQRHLNPIPCTYDPCQALRSTPAACGKVRRVGLRDGQARLCGTATEISSSSSSSCGSRIIKVLH